MNELQSVKTLRQSQATTKLYQETLQEYGLKANEYIVLTMTLRNAIRVTDLAKELKSETTYITAILNSLRAKKYVDTRYDDKDARVRLTIANAAGWKQVTTIEKRLAEVIGSQES